METYGMDAVYKRWMAKLRNGRNCRLCNECDPAVLSFYHPGPTVKEYDILDAKLRDAGYHEIEAEVSDHEILCANCYSRAVAEQNNLSRLVAEWGKRLK